MQKPVYFQLDMDLIYCNGEGNIVPVVYKGASANGLLDIIHIKYGANLNVYDSNLQLLDQTDFSNMPKNPLDYKNEVGTGI